MKSDEQKIRHFGNFLRWRFDNYGGIAGVSRRSKLDGSGGLSETKLLQLVKLASPPESLRLVSRQILAKAVGFDTVQGHGNWAALDAAWRQTPMALYKGKDGPIFPRGVLTHGELDQLSYARSFDEVVGLVKGYKIEYDRRAAVAGKIHATAPKADAARGNKNQEPPPKGGR